MDEKATGIILRVRPLTETSLIIHWITPEAGRIATVAKGARRPKSPFRGKLDLFFAATFTFQRSRRSELHNLKELELRETHSALRTSISYLSQCAYCAALIEQVTETDTPLPEIFSLTEKFLAYFDARPTGHLPVFAFEMKLLELLGMQPNLQEEKLSEGSRKILHQCSTLDWKLLSPLKLSQAQVTEIEHFLNRFLILNLGKLPPNRPSAISC